MNSRFTVTTAASDPCLLSTSELRAAIGIDDGSKDTALTTLGNQVSSAIARACGIAGDGVNTPTLKQETCSELFRLPKCLAQLRLARCPVTSIASVTIATDVQDEATYEIDVASGRLARLCGDTEVNWPYGKITVAYVAGYATVPADLKLAASKAVALLYTEGARDSNLKRESIPGVMEREWWVSPNDDPLLSKEIMELLAPYRQYWI
jgi:hypothetical protein